MMEQQSSVPTTPPFLPQFSAIISNASSASLAPKTRLSKSSFSNSEEEFSGFSSSLALEEALGLVWKLLGWEEEGEREEEWERGLRA